MDDRARLAAIAKLVDEALAIAKSMDSKAASNGMVSRLSRVHGMSKKVKAAGQVK